MKKCILLVTLLICSFTSSAFSLKDIASGFANKQSNNQYDQNQHRKAPESLNAIDAYMPDSNSEWAYNVQRNRYSGRYNVLGRVHTEICFENAYENPMQSAYTDLRQKTYQMGGNILINVRVNTQQDNTDTTCPNKLKMSGIAASAERESPGSSSGAASSLLSMFQ